MSKIELWVVPTGMPLRDRNEFTMDGKFVEKLNVKDLHTPQVIDARRKLQSPIKHRSKTKRTVHSPKNVKKYGKMWKPK